MSGNFYTKKGRAGVSLMEVAAENQIWCERLYDEKAGQLLLYGRALGLSHSESEDILQETFISLLKLADAPEQPDHYAYRAFRNRALNYKRSLWRRLTREIESLRWFERDSAESPLEREAMRCLESLPPEQREVIVLKIWSEYTFDQIGKLLDLSANTVAGRYRYGMEKLRVCLKGKEYERTELNREPIAQMGAATSFA
jgi:RNA polymerase sigma-70 factor (ECF subfamily)